MEKHGLYQFDVRPFELSEETKFESGCNEAWVYDIYDLESKPNLIRESDEWFDSKSRAELAAIGHISLLENGEG